MNCENFQQIIGMRCNPVGSALEVVTPFTFSDGDGFDIFVQAMGPQMHFFDDGFTLMHLHSIGISLKDKKQWKPLKSIAEVNGATLSEDGVFETLCPADNPSIGFARLVSTLLGVTAWEREQFGVEQDNDVFIEEVALHLKAWKPNEAFLDNPTAKGFSGRSLKFNFQIGNQLVDAIQPHGATTGAELRKIIDLNYAASHKDSTVLVVMDDRNGKSEAAKQETDILSRVATVWPMTSLIAASGATGRSVQ